MHIKPLLNVIGVTSEKLLERLVDLYIHAMQLTGYANESNEKNIFAVLCE